jgi:hypothetical protein
MSSVRAPATVIVTALLVIILLSSARTTYRLAPAEHSSPNRGYALAACESRPVILAPAEPRRACPWPRRPLPAWSGSRGGSSGHELADAAPGRASSHRDSPEH